MRVQRDSARAACAFLGLTEAGAANLVRGCATGRLTGGVATDKLVRDGFAAAISTMPRGWGKPALPTAKGREAARVLRAAGWR